MNLAIRGIEANFGQEPADSFHSDQYKDLKAVSSQLSESAPEAGPTTLHMSLSEPTGQFWRALERLHGQISGGAPLVPFLVRAVLDAWRDTIAGQVANADVYLRNRSRCASPVCSSHKVTRHHVVFRSHGNRQGRWAKVAPQDRPEPLAFASERASRSIQLLGGRAA